MLVLSILKHYVTFFSKFIIVGLLNSVLGYCVIFSSMYLMKISPEASNIMGYSIGLVMSYFLNRNFTFKSNLAKRREFFRFLTVFYMAYGANFFMLLLLIYSFKANYALSQVLAGAVYFLVSFFMNKHYVFKQIVIE